MWGWTPRNSSWEVGKEPRLKAAMKDDKTEGKKRRNWHVISKAGSVICTKLDERRKIKAGEVSAPATSWVQKQQ